MDLTTRSQQARVRRRADRRREGQPGRRARPPGGRPAHRRAGPGPSDGAGGRRRPGRPRAARSPSLVTALPAAAGSTVSAPQTSRNLLNVLAAAERIAKDAADEYVSGEHLLLALAEVPSEVATTLTRLGASPAALRAALHPGARLDPGHQPGPRGHLPGAGEVRRRPDRGRPRGQARPGDRAGLRDPPGGPGAVPADQEQPGADRRARRRQDRRRRGPGPADRRRRRAGIAAGQAADLARPGRDGGRREVPRRVRGAAQGRARPRSRTPTARCVTFIDELHTVVGAGATGEGAMDAGNMLKPMLARGELRMVGATTLDEYREHIEKDPALERRFQQVLVGEPSVEDTIGILRGLAGRYEAHHKVQISDGALVAAATLSDRYITSRFLPDKAIDLIDEAASRLRMEIDSRPVEIDELQRAVDRLKMEELALSKETDPASVARLAGAARRAGRPDRAAGRPQRPLGAGEVRAEPGRRAEGEARRAAHARPSGPSARATSRPRPGCCTARSRRPRRSWPRRRPSRSSRPT